MEFITRQPLLELNTMALPARAEYFCRVANMDDVQQALTFARERQLRVTVLGAGSNIILAGDIAGLVIQVAMMGISVEPQGGGTALVTAGAGENWHAFVTNMLEQNYYGLENLSLIPGLVGAAPVQNIGAYGVELSDRFIALVGVDTGSGEIRQFSASDCRFGYRHSAFKAELQDAYIIVSISLELQTEPTVEISYPSLYEALAKHENSAITPKLVSETVCRIRSEKLPDPAENPNVGSFFKNPVVSCEKAGVLAEQYPGLVTYPQGSNQVKIPAAWLIESAGWKGVARGACVVHRQHALVLTHSGHASGRDILTLAAEIAADIQQKFAIELEIEPRILGS